MKSRNPLNSAALKQKFPEIYQEFFSRCQTVVSSPHFFTWAGEYVGYWGGIMVLQKLPLRFYVGIEAISQIESQKIVFDGNPKSYSLKENKFKKDSFEHLAEVRLLEFLNSELPFSLGTKALKIHLLSEIPFGGSGSSGALCSALSLALGLFCKQISPFQVEAWGNKKPSELLNTHKDSDFNKVFRLAWKALAAYRGKETSGGTIFNCLVDSKFPTFYFLKPSKTIKLPLNVAENYPLIDNVDFEAGGIDELFQLPKTASWPLDFGLLYLGEPRGNLPFSIWELQEAIKETADFLKKEFSGNGFPSSKALWEGSVSVMNLLSSQVLLKMGQLLKAGAREDKIKAFLRAIDKHQVLFSLLGLLPKTIDSVTSIVHTQVGKIDDWGCGLKLVSTTKKDIILFVFPHGKGRDIIPSVFKQIEQDLGLTLQLGYASWLDGIETKGLKIEQMLEEKIYSDFVSKDSIFVKEFKGNKSVLQLLLSPEEFERRKSDIDLLLDDQTHRLYAKSQLLTSREIHSAKAAIDILKVLLSKKNQFVSNKDMPGSSYSSDRYEMQGKIALPLIKAVEKKTNKKLGLPVSGAVTDFKLRLNLNNITLWLKEKR